MAHLNHDTMRLILLEIERKPAGEELTAEIIAEKVGRDIDEVKYCCMKLNEGNLLTMRLRTMPKGLPAAIYVQELTYDGHNVLDAIKDDNVWNDVKAALKNAGTLSWPIILATCKAKLAEFGLIIP